MAALSVFIAAPCLLTLDERTAAKRASQSGNVSFRSVAALDEDVEVVIKEELAVCFCPVHVETFNNGSFAFGNECGCLFVGEFFAHDNER